MRGHVSDQGADRLAAGDHVVSQHDGTSGGRGDQSEQNLEQGRLAARHLIAVQPPAARFLPLVAETDGEVVGWGSAGLNTRTSQTGQAGLTIYVHPEHRRQGIGGALAQRLHEHLGEIGAVRARTFAAPDGVEFGRKLGYAGTRQMHYAGVDPRELPERPHRPPESRW